MSDERIFEDAFNLLCGELIGEGIHRKVYRCRLLPQYVVKVEIPEAWRYFANVLEMKFWNEHNDNKAAAKWLAPCEYLSPDGRILLQQRAEPIRSDDVLPSRIPAFLTDVKRENFGFIGDRLVCVDYALHRVKLDMRPQKVTW